MKISFIFTALAALALAGCSMESRLVGTWQSEAGNTAEFTKDHMYRITSGANAVWGRWFIKDGELVLTVGDSELVVPAELDGDTFVYGSGDREISFSKD